LTALDQSRRNRAEAMSEQRGQALVKYLFVSEAPLAALCSWAVFSLPFDISPFPPPSVVRTGVMGFMDRRPAQKLVRFMGR
jgi:hypothetical protein